MERTGIQQIRVGGETAVVIPLDTWNRLVQRLEDLEDEVVSIIAGSDPEKDFVEHDELCRLFGRSPLRYLRGRAGMTQTELARRTGLSQSFIAKVESNHKKLSPSSQRRIAKVLGIPASRLVC